MNAAEFNDALAALLFERAEREIGITGARLRGMHVHPTHASVCIVEGDRLWLVRVELCTGEATIAFDDARRSQRHERARGH